MQQIQSTISSRNQTVVPANVREALGVGAGDKILWRLVQVGEKTKAIAESVPTSWAKYSRGLGKDIWENINIKRYIGQLRDEWDK